jgi:hypothetical protein
VVAQAHACLLLIAIGGDNDFQLLVYQESMYNVQIWRVYNFRITLMSIVGPMIFVRWIQFARGTLLLGPFVRMIAKVCALLRSSN